MALTDNIRPYEILFRFNNDGTVAAHVQHIREVKDGAEIISTTIQPATALATSGEEFNTIVSAIDVSLAVERDVLLADKAALEIQVTTLTEERNALLEVSS